MSAITIHVPPSNLAVIRCIFCGRVKEVTLARFVNTRHELSAKCACGKTFTVKLNFRKHYRKPVTLLGQFINLSNSGKGWTPTRITDLSLGGLCLKMEFLVGAKPGDTLRVRFKLDGKKPVAIDKEVKVKFAKDDLLGCAFVNLALEEKDLGFYLLNL